MILRSLRLLRMTLQPYSLKTVTCSDLLYAMLSNMPAAPMPPPTHIVTKP